MSSFLSQPTREYDCQAICRFSTVERIIIVLPFSIDYVLSGAPCAHVRVCVLRLRSTHLVHVLTTTILLICFVEK